MKLGMAGVSMLFSSGDNGVAGNGGQCCTKAKCAGGTYNNGGSGTFNPSFPATWYVQCRIDSLVRFVRDVS